MSLRPENGYRFSEKTARAVNEIEDVCDELMEKYVEKGFTPDEVLYLILHAAFSAELSYVLGNRSSD